MPIVANPASPFSGSIASKAGATEQWNRVFPTLANLYADAGRNYTSASAQTAQNQTSASAVSAGLQARKQAQDADIEAQREDQFRQIAAAKEMQARQQQFEMARASLPITRAEEADNVARMNGLVEIERQVREGILTPEQAGDHRLQLLTQVKAFDNRFKSQQASAMEQRTQMERKAFDENQKNITLAQQLGKQTAGQNWIPITQANGDTEFYGYDAQKGTFYQIGKRTAASEKEKPVSAYADEGGGFSYKKALPEAKAEAEAAYPIVKNDEGKDTNAQKRAEYTQEMVRKREDEHRAGMNKGGPVTAPQQSGDQNDQSSPKAQIEGQLAALQQQFPDPSKAPPAIQQQMRQLYQQYKSQQ